MKKFAIKRCAIFLVIALFAVRYVSATTSKEFIDSIDKLTKSLIKGGKGMVGAMCIYENIARIEDANKELKKIKSISFQDEYVVMRTIIALKGLRCKLVQALPSDSRDQLKRGGLCYKNSMYNFRENIKILVDNILKPLIASDIPWTRFNGFRNKMLFFVNQIEMEVWECSREYEAFCERCERAKDGVGYEFSIWAAQDREAKKPRVHSNKPSKLRQSHTDCDDEED
jgi:hypothetical protein